MHHLPQLVISLDHFSSSLDGMQSVCLSYGTHKSLVTRLDLEITKDMSGGILKDITKGASILGMFILAVLVQRWVSINFPSPPTNEEKAVRRPPPKPARRVVERGGGVLGQAFSGWGESGERSPTNTSGGVESLMIGGEGPSSFFSFVWV